MAEEGTPLLMSEKEQTEKMDIDGVRKRGFFHRILDMIKRDVQQFYALTMKNITIHSRQHLSNCFQIATPIIIMLFIFLLQLIVNYLIANLSRFSSEDDDDESRRALSDHQGYTLKKFSSLALDDVIEFSSFLNFSLPNTILYSNSSDYEVDPFIEHIELSYLYTYEFQYNQTANNVDVVLYDELEKVDNNATLSFDFLGSTKFRKFDPTGTDGFDVVVQFERDYSGQDRHRFSRKSMMCYTLSMMFNERFPMDSNTTAPCEFVLGTGLMDIISSTYLQLHTGDSKQTIKTTVTQMPFWAPPDAGFTLNLAEAMGQFFFPVILLLIFPVILHTIVSEKENEVKQVMTLMGMKERNYLLATYLFELFVYLISGGIFFIMGMILQYRFFMQTNFLVLLIIVIGSALSTVSLAFFMSAFITKAFIATIFGYLMAIFVPVAGIILNEFVMTPGAYHFKFLLLIPVLPITDAIYYSTSSCLNMQCLTLGAFKSNPDFAIAIGFMYINPIIYFVLSLYFDKVIPKPWGVTKHPLYFLDWLFKFCRKKDKFDHDDDSIDEEEDEDVKELRLKIGKGEINAENSGILVQGLRKHFGRGSKKNKAVDGVYFNVKRKECLGLLGPNGAGKTTSVNMICGMFQQTAGTAFVNGYDIRYDMDKVHQSMGLCPQFSVVWTDLTPKEHLLFYTRMKGYPILKEQDHVNKILKEVGLMVGDEPSWFQNFISFFFPKKKAKALSGGMRRRLSIAIALCGDPDVLVLDEPTTGLDPRNRRDIWDVVIKQKKERSVVLTTHSMEEADALSDRIAIMAAGKLVCFGSSLRLKNRFGNGYVMNIKYQPGKRNTAITFIRQVATDLKLQLAIIKEFGCNVTFESRLKEDVEGGLFPVADLFEMLEENKVENSIMDFEINQTTLEDVFLNVIQKEERKRFIENNGEDPALVDETEIRKKPNETEVILVEPSNEFKGLVDKKEVNFVVEERSISYEGKSLELKEIEDLTVISGEEEVVVKLEVREKEKMDVVFSKDVGTNFRNLVDKRLKELEESETTEFETETEGEEDESTEEESSEVPGKKVEKPKQEVEVEKKEIKAVEKKKSQPKEEFDLSLNESETGKKFIIEKKNIGDVIKKSIRDTCSQIVFLLLKNFLLSLRQWKVTVLQLSSPFLVVLLLFILTLIARIDTGSYYIHPPSQEVLGTAVKKCNSWGNVPCFDFVYTVNNNNSFADDIMDVIISERELVEDEHYLVFDYEEDMVDWILDHENTTQIAISFSNITTEVFPPPPYPPIFEKNVTMYTLYFNGTQDLDNNLFEFKALIDNTILNLLDEPEGGNTNRMKFRKQGLPKIQSKMAVSGQANIFSSTGPLFFSLVGMIIFVSCSYQIVVEKEKSLKTGLELIGLKNFSYFASWFITYTIISFLTTVITMISGYIFAMEVFLYCNPLLMFMLLFVYSMSLICFGFAITPLFNKGKAVIIFGFIVTGISFILNFFLANGTLIYLLFELEDGWQLIYWAFELLYPPFNFAKMFSDIVNKTLKTYDFALNKYVPNDGYSFKQFIQKNEWYDFDNQASFYSIFFLIFNSLVYFIMFWYLDNVLPRSNFTPKKPWFFLTPSYWGLDVLLQKRKVITADSEKKGDVEMKQLDGDLIKEYEKARDMSNNSSIRVLNAKKNYNVLFRSPVRALKGIDFCSENNSCLALLGDNGAGKSTTIGVLSGIVPVSSGDMFVGDLSVKVGKDDIRDNIGVTLQDNILWDDLTAGDHIRLFSQIKNVKGIKQQVVDRLTEVSLYKQRNDRSKTFSGGMKRRLCVALSYTGDNNVCLLDEPTTGLDPFSKREVWKLIQEKKKSNTTILTTHSMEEADSLSDKIVILRHGEIVCVGDSLHLKNKYDAGYVLKLICLTGKEEKTQKLVDENLPCAVLVVENAGNFIFNVKSEDVKELISFLRTLEQEKLKKDTILKDFGISHTTLEDVYMKVNGDVSDSSNRLKRSALNLNTLADKEEEVLEDV